MSECEGLCVFVCLPELTVRFCVCVCVVYVCVCVGESLNLCVGGCCVYLCTCACPCCVFLRACALCLRGVNVSVRGRVFQPPQQGAVGGDVCVCLSTGLGSGHYY